MGHQAGHPSPGTPASQRCCGQARPGALKSRPLFVSRSPTPWMSAAIVRPSTGPSQQLRRERAAEAAGWGLWVRSPAPRLWARVPEPGKPGQGGEEPLARPGSRILAFLTARPCWGNGRGRAASSRERGRRHPGSQRNTPKQQQRGEKYITEPSICGKQLPSNLHVLLQLSA
ncbi:unnamed protein product [Rangifer tarandus platyrhynchus]|uniref:Uncharacterized protein n=2 Tax=Rangifer tarandus platyrhynchus TaxID=3082113 RepID=A0ACB0FPJ3_RANTA|nr:unnamed protein product [Rangifer tarandus platyrhynchus]CAI9714241.1 unnamed protein product [Rangifer tarandus platyrhynchus]